MTSFVVDAPSSTLPSTLVVTGTHSLQRQFTLAGGVYGMVSDRGVLYEEGEALTLEHGSVLLGSEGLVTVHVDRHLVHALQGAIHITKTAHHLTVSAITSPALIVQDGSFMMVPLGMQWRWPLGKEVATIDESVEQWTASHTVRALPSHFLQENYKTLYRIATPFPLPAKRTLMPKSASTPFASALLPQARQAAKRRHRDEILGALRRHVDAGAVETVAHILAQESLQDALRSPQGMQVLSALLSHCDASDTSMKMVLLSYITRDDAPYFLSLFHPQYWNVAWSLMGSERAPEARLAMVFALPFADGGPEALSSFVWQRYRGALSLVLAEQKEPSAVLSSFLPLFMAHRERLEALGYPRRAEHLSATLVGSIVEQGEKTPVMQKTLSALQNRGRLDLDAVVVEALEEEEVEPEELITVLSPDDVEKKAYELLRDAGAIFTVHSDIEATAPHVATVRQVLFAGSNGDLMVNFTFNVFDETVDAIDLGNGKSFPYVSTFEGFLEWIRG